MRNKKAATNEEAPGCPLEPGAASRPPDLHFTVALQDPSERLDALLSRRRDDVSRSQFKNLIGAGAVRVNGRMVKASYVPVPGDRVEVWLPPPATAAQLVPEAMALEILYEDEAILVLNKPHGLVVHPAPGHTAGTLVHGLLAHNPRLACQGAPLRPGIVHRLDQDTSGAMVVAKTEAAYLDLIRQFKAHTIRKEYLALVYGRFSASTGTIAAAIGRHPQNRKKMAVTSGGREALSHWQVLEVLPGVTLVRVRIETGRTHQIRVHLSHSGHPVVGDGCYGGGRARAQSFATKAVRALLLPLKRQLLHAHRLGLRHPLTGTELRFEAPLPADFDNVLRALRELAAAAPG